MTNNFWKGRNVFVTGSTGLLGSWLTKELVNKGASVTALIRDSIPHSNLNSSGYINKVNVVRGTVEDFYTLERALNEYEIDTVFHLAAQTIVETANRNPLSTFETNIKGTWCLLEASRRVSTVKRILVASSDKAYGNQIELPYNETNPLQGSHPYDVSKSCTDLIAQAYYKTYNLPVCITRCGNLYGGGDLNFNRIVPGTIRAIMNNQSPVIRSDGTFIRDYFYVKDGVYSYLHLAEKMAETNILGEVFNFSNEIQISVIQLTELILKIMGKQDLKPTILNQANNEIRHQYLSAQKAHKILGWQPIYTLEQGLKETVLWYKNFFSLQDSIQMV